MSVSVDQHSFTQSMLGQTKAALIASSCCLFQLIALKRQYLPLPLEQSPQLGTRVPEAASPHQLLVYLNANTCRHTVEPSSDRH